MWGICFHVDYILTSLFCAKDLFFRVFCLLPRYILLLLLLSVFCKVFSLSFSADVPEEEKKREKLIGELCQTEETYLDNLKLRAEYLRSCFCLQTCEIVGKTVTV